MEGIKMKKLLIIISCVIILSAAAIIAIRIAAPDKDEYVKTEARVSQRTDYTRSTGADDYVYTREYIFVYNYSGTEYHAAVTDDDPDGFPLLVGDKTDVLVNKENPRKVILPDKTAPESFIDYVIRFIKRDKKYR